MDKIVPDWITQKAVNFVIKRLKNVDPNTKKKLADALQKEANDYTSANGFYDYDSLVERLETRIPSSMTGQPSPPPSGQGYGTREFYPCGQPTMHSASAPQTLPSTARGGYVPTVGSQTTYQYQTRVTPSAPAYYYETQRPAQTQQMPSSMYPCTNFVQTVPAVSDDYKRSQPQQFYSTSCQYPSHVFAQSFGSSQQYSTSGQTGSSYAYSRSRSPSSWSSSQASMFSSNTTPVQCPILDNPALPPMPESAQVPVQWVYGQGSAEVPRNPYDTQRQFETEAVNCSDDERWAGRGQLGGAALPETSAPFMATSRQAPKKLKGCLKKPKEDVEFTINHPNLPIGAKLPRSLHMS